MLVFDAGFFATAALVALRLADAFITGLVKLFFVLALVAGEGLRLAVTLTFPADDFFPLVPAVFDVGALRVTDFRCVFVFMERASIFA